MMILVAVVEFVVLMQPTTVVPTIMIEPDLSLEMIVVVVAKSRLLQLNSLFRFQQRQINLKGQNFHLWWKLLMAGTNHYVQLEALIVVVVVEALVVDLPAALIKLPLRPIVMAIMMKMANFVPVVS